MEEKYKELNSRLLELAGEGNYKSGIALFEDGAVLDIIRDSRGLDTRVANDKGRFEKVRITLKKNYFASKCTCRSRGTAICEHSVAAIMQFYKDNPDSIPFPLVVSSLHNSLKNGGDEAPEDPMEAVSLDITARSNTHNNLQGIQQIGLRQLIEEMSYVKGNLNLTYQGIGFPVGESKWHSCKFSAEILYEDKIYSASNLRRLIDTGSAVGGMLLSHFSSQDQQIMRFLVQNGDFVGSNYVLSAFDTGSFFHCLIGFDRFYANRMKININSQLANLVLQVTSTSEGIIVEPRLRIDKLGVIPTTGIQIIATRSGFWLGHKGQYWWTPAVGGTTWLYSFLKGERTLISEEDYGRLKHLQDEGLLPVSILHSEDCAVMETGKFVPVLSIDWNKSFLQVRLEFSYDGMRVSLNDSKMVWNGNKYLVRNDVAEDGIELRLQEMGFIKMFDVPGAFAMRKLEQIGNFLDEELPIISKTWEIYCSQEFERKRGFSGDMKFSVTTIAETTDWFELKYNFFTKAGTHANWKHVVDAVLTGQNYVRLENGGVAKITDKIRSTLEANLYTATNDEITDESTLRFSSYSAAYLTSVLNDTRIANKSNWQNLSKRLVTSREESEKINLGHLEGVLRDYQKEGVAWLNAIEESGFHGILADEMGLGKTLQTLAAIQYSHKKNPKANTSIIICPTSLVQNWLAEAKKFMPELKVGVIYGVTRNKVIKNLNRYNLVITSYALLRRDIESYRNYKFHYIALDEAQHIKNSTTANSKTCKEIQANHRLMLTGTPIENSMREIWSLFDFILPGYLGNYKNFHERYYDKKDLDDRQVVVQQLIEKIRPFMLRRKKIDVCNELPPKIEQVMYCELAEKQREIYDSILIEARKMLKLMKQEGIQKHRIEILSVLLRLRQLCCDPSLLPESMLPDSSDVGSAKLELFKELVLESIDSEHRMLVFSQFTGMLGVLRKWLDEEGIKYEYLDGSTQNRLDHVNNFNNDDTIPIFLLSLKAGGTGLNLTGANTVIHYDQWWNPMVEDQATDRSHRIGQTRQVVAYKLIAKDTIEEKILGLQGSKRDLFNQIMSGVPADMHQLTEEDFEFLLEQNSNPDNDLEE